MSSAIDGRSLPPDLQARYGVGRRSRLPLIAGLIGIAAFIAALAFVTFNLVSPKVTYKLLAWNDVAADRVDVTFDVRRSQEWDVYCVLRAQDESRTDVGYAVVGIPRGTSYEQVTRCGPWPRPSSSRSSRVRPGRHPSASCPRNSLRGSSRRSSHGLRPEAESTPVMTPA
ncbi:MAG: hypothetical protein RLZ94_1010 [Actinomycetota bacterium]